jgi:hypothetical protein
MAGRIDSTWGTLNAAQVAVLMAGVLVTVSGCFADASGADESVDSNTGPLVYAPTTTTWTQGVNPPTGVDTHMQIDKGFCYLSKIGGSFRGFGESVYLAAEGNWYLKGSSGQSGVTATTSCITFAALGSTGPLNQVYISSYPGAWKSTSGAAGGTSGQVCFLTGFRGETNGGGEGAAMVRAGSGWQLQVSHQSGAGIQAQYACIARTGGSISVAEDTSFVPQASDCSGSTCNALFTTSHGRINFCAMNSLFGRLRGGGEFASVLPYSAGNLYANLVNLHTQQGLGSGLRTSASCIYY